MLKNLFKNTENDIINLLDKTRLTGKLKPKDIKNLIKQLKQIENIKNIKPEIKYNLLKVYQQLIKEYKKIIKETDLQIDDKLLADLKSVEAKVKIKLLKDYVKSKEFVGSVIIRFLSMITPLLIFQVYLVISDGYWINIKTLLAKPTEVVKTLDKLYKNNPGLKTMLLTLYFIGLFAFYANLILIGTKFFDILSSAVVILKEKLKEFKKKKF